MPLNDPRRNVSGTEAKLTLLYAANALGSVTEDELWTFVAENELADYITTRLRLGELLAGGELQRGAHALRGQVMITDAGRRSLTLFSARVPHSVRQTIDRAAPDFVRRAELERHVEAVYELASRGDFRLRLTLREGELPLLVVRLQTARRDVAARALRRFGGRASALVSELYAMAAGAGAPDEALADGFSVERYSPREYVAACELEARQAQLALSLLLPTEDAARAFLARAQAPGFGDRLLRLLLAPPDGGTV